MGLRTSVFRFSGELVLSEVVPLYYHMTMLSLLLALDKPKVNYFSLDIEGAELQVLRSLPWHLVDIEVLPHINFIIFCVFVVKFCFKGYHRRDSTSWAGVSRLKEGGLSTRQQN